MKGIILAGGSGARLFPITKVISKQLVPIYDKPLIYYPLSVLMLAEIKEILIISNPEYIESYRTLLGDGSQLGIVIEYLVQEKPAGLPQAFTLGKDFIGDDNVCLILGDNLFYGTHFSPILKECAKLKKGAILFGYFLSDPSAFGVVEFDNDLNVISLEEKPKNPKSKYAIPGLYFFDNSVIEKAAKLKPSARGELEIIDLKRAYLKEKTLKVQPLGRGFAWLDTGTYAGLSEASEFVRTIQKRTSLYIGCIEEIAYKKGFINKEQLIKLAGDLSKTEYGEYLLGVADLELFEENE